MYVYVCAWMGREKVGVVWEEFISTSNNGVAISKENCLLYISVEGTLLKGPDTILYTYMHMYMHMYM